MKRYKIASGACRTKLPTKILLHPRLGARRAWFWRAPNLSRVALRCHFAGFRDLWGGSWPLLDASWAVLGRSWPSLGWFGALLGCILPPRTSPGLDFKEFQDMPGFVLEGFGGMFSHNSFLFWVCSGLIMLLCGTCLQWKSRLLGVQSIVRLLRLALHNQML